MKTDKLNIEPETQNQDLQSKSDFEPVVIRHPKHDTTREIEVDMARFFGVRTNLCLPNISWGFGIHECDLLIVTKAGYALEVEIKVSRSDMVKDQSKRHCHESNKIKRLFFAIPQKLEKYIELIPERAGIIIVEENGRCKLLRTATTNKRASKLTDVEKYELARLGALRIWDLKQKINAYKFQNYNKTLPKRIV